MFEPISFDHLNETDVREEILAPLIKHLGYRSGTPNNVIREQSLRYPRAFIGRKNPNKDPILRGKADYILEAGGLVRWVIEAKAPTVELDLDAIDQAYTYANHPEIRAVYFVLSNGKSLSIFQTNRGPESAPVLSISYEDLNGMLLQLSNLLSPKSILRDHPFTKPDIGKPLGTGLRSFVRITNGLIRYEENSLGNRALNEIQIGISDGAVERDEQGQMIVFLKTNGPSRSLQELNERLGLASFEMVSMDNEISSDSAAPTEFVYEHTVVLHAGEKILDINTWQEIVLPINISCHVTSQAQGILNGDRFAGKFFTRVNYLETKMSIDMNGSFDVHLA